MHALNIPDCPRRVAAPPIPRGRRRWLRGVGNLLLAVQLVALGVVGDELNRRPELRFADAAHRYLADAGAVLTRENAALRACVSTSPAAWRVPAGWAR